jgi:hypothetical protein
MSKKNMGFAAGAKIPKNCTGCGRRFTPSFVSDRKEVLCDLCRKKPKKKRTART